MKKVLQSWDQINVLVFFLLFFFFVLFFFFGGGGCNRLAEETRTDCFTSIVVFIVTLRHVCYYTKWFWTTVGWFWTTIFYRFMTK